MATQVQFRRGTAAQNNSFTGGAGELTVNLSSMSLRVHDGTTAGGFELARADLTNVTGSIPAQPGGIDTSVQYNDAGSLTGSTNFTFNNITQTTTMANVVVTGQVGSGLIPNANITYDLGTATNRWKDLYLSGSTIYIGAANIKSYQQVVLIQGLSVTASGAVDLANVPSAGGMFVAGTAGVGANLNVTGAAAVGANLSVTGNAAVTGNATFSANVAVANVLSSNVALANIANVANIINAPNANISSNLVAGNANIAGNLAVVGNTVFTGTVNGGNAAFANISVQNITLSGTTSLDRINNGASQLIFNSLNGNLDGQINGVAVITLADNQIVARQTLNALSGITTTTVTASGDITTTSDVNADVVNAAGGVNTSTVDADSGVTTTTLNANAGVTTTTVTSTAGVNTTTLDANAGVTTTSVTANVGMTTANLTATANVNLGAVANVHIQGGTTGQYLQTNGLGTLVWATIPAGDGISNGTSNVLIPVAGGNVNTSVGAVANVFVVAASGATVNGELHTTGNANIGGNINTPFSLNQEGLRITVGDTSTTPAELDGAGITFGEDVANLRYVASTQRLVSSITLGAPSANITGTLDAATVNAGDLVVAGTTDLGAVGNVTITGGTANQYLQTDGSGTLTWATVNSDRISNTTSNVAIAVAAGNVVTTVAGSEVLVVTSTGANVTGYVAATANVSGLNLVAQDTVTTANLNASGANVSLGAIGNLHITGGTANQFLQTDGSGTLSWATISASRIANGTSNVDIATQDGNVTIGVNGQANVVRVTSNGTHASTTIQNDVTISGNLSVTGSTTYLSTTNQFIIDPLIDVGVGANNSPLTSNDSRDRGIVIHSYTSGVNLTVNNAGNPVALGATSIPVTSTTGVVLGQKIGSTTSPSAFAAGTTITGITPGVAITLSAPTLEAIPNATVLAVGNDHTGFFGWDNSTDTMLLAHDVTVNEVAGTVTVNELGAITLGNVTAQQVSLTGAANLIVGGGAAGQTLITNGSGTLTWGASSLKYTKEWHVSVDQGNNSNNGSEAAPYATITKALTDAAAGDVIYVHGGTYTENITISKAVEIVAADGNAATLSGTVTFDATTGVVHTHGLKLTGTVMFGATAEVNVINGELTGTVTKSDSGTLRFVSSKITPTAFNIVASGTVTIAGGEQHNITINNNSAAVYIHGSDRLHNTTLTLGTLEVSDAEITSTNATTNAITTAAGTTLKISTAHIKYGAGLARIAVAGSYTLEGVVFDQANSTFTGATLLREAAISDTISLLGNLTVAGSTNLGAVANVHITGGTTGQYLQTDGSGTLSWVSIVQSEPTKYDYEWHVDPVDGIDAQTGSLEKPKQTIAATLTALSLVAGTHIVYLHPGVYTEAVSVLNASIDFVGVTNNGLMVDLQGNWTLNSTTGVRARGVKFSGQLDFNSTGTYYFYDSIIAGQVNTNATSTVYMIDTVVSSTNFNVTSATKLYITGGSIAQMAINANAARVTIYDVPSVKNITNTTGVLVIRDSVIHTTSAGQPALTSGAAGELVLLNTSVYGTTTATQGFINVAGTYTINNTTYDVSLSSIAGTMSTIEAISTDIRALGDVNVEGNLAVTSLASLRVAGAVNNRYIRANATGGLEWATVTVTGIANGTSNVSVINNANVEVSIAGTANVLSITPTEVTTALDITTSGDLTGGTLTVTGTTNLGAVGNVTVTGGTSGQFLRTDGAGALSWQTPNLAFISNGTANVRTFNNGNVTVSAGSTANVLVVTDTGANVAGTGNITGNLGVGGNVSVGGNLAIAGTTSFVGNVTMANLSVTANLDLTGPANIRITGGTNGDVLRTDGLGHLSWGPAMAAGATTQLQYNDNGQFGANASFTYTNTTKTLVMNETTINSTGISHANALTIRSTLAAAPLDITTANGVTSTSNVGGTITIRSGSGDTGGIGGNITIQAGEGKNGVDGGDILIRAGQTDTGQAGNLTLAAGVTTAGGTYGSINFSGKANLGLLSNLTILGGAQNQLLTTDGAGGLTWTSGSSITVTEIKNGTSKAHLPTNNGNLLVDVNGVANVMTVSSTQVTIGNAAPLSGLTNSLLTVTGNNNSQVKATVHNKSNTTAASSDFVAYSFNATDTTGYVNLGITSNAFIESTRTVTSLNEGYLFMSAPTGSASSGNLVIATDKTGATNAIEFFTGGLDQVKDNTKRKLLINNAGVSSNANVSFTGANVSLGAIGNLKIAGATVAGAFLRAKDTAGAVEWSLEIDGGSA